MVTGWREKFSFIYLKSLLSETHHMFKYTFAVMHTIYHVHDVIIMALHCVERLRGEMWPRFPLRSRAHLDSLVQFVIV